MGLGGAGRRHASSGAFALDRLVPADDEPPADAESPADLDAQAGDAEHVSADSANSANSARVALNRVDARGLTLARADGGGPSPSSQIARRTVGTGGRNRAAAAVRTPADAPPDDGESYDDGESDGDGDGGRVYRTEAGSDPGTHPACGTQPLSPAPANRDDTGPGTAVGAVDARTVPLRPHSPARAGDADTDARRHQAGDNHVVHVHDSSGRRAADGRGGGGR